MVTIKVKYLRILLVGAILAALAGAAFPPRVGVSADSVELGQVADSDWPQLARDAQRTGTSPQEVAGPYRFYWRWLDVPSASRAQPVIAGGRLFIGALNGIMFALDAAYDARGGEPRIVWQQDLHSPIRTSAGVDGSVVIVGTHHGTIYGLCAESGNPLWTVPTGGAILAAPAVQNGVAYLGSASGYFYAIRTADGAVLWNRDVGAPVLASAALSVDGGTVYFLAEDMNAYALNANSGAIVWRTQLQGQSGSDRWPVVAGGRVFFRTQPTGYFQDLLHAGDAVLDSAGTRLADWSADWNIVRPKIVAHLSAVPHEQSFFALDATTGQLAGPAPVLYTFGNNDPPSPPVVHQGSLYLPYRARHGIQTDSPVAVHVTTKYDAELGRMNPTTLDIAGLTTPSTFSYQFRLTSDEGAVLTAAGNLLLVDSWERLGGIRLDDRTLIGIADLSQEGDCKWGAGPNPIQILESCPYFPMLPLGEGHARSGAVVGAGRIVWRVDGALAAIGPAAGKTNTTQTLPQPYPTPLPISAANSLPSDSLKTYVWWEPAAKAPSQVPPDLRQRLATEVERIVSSGTHLMPYLIQRGIHGVGSYSPDVTNDSEPARVADSNAYWYDPGELVYTLSLAYPYLEPSLQTRVRGYLDAEMARFPPLQRLPWPPDSWLKQGQAREYYRVPYRASVSAWPPPGVPIQTLYALWVYARNTADWDYLRVRWNEVRALFDAKRNSIDTYAEIAGAIGYARIAKHLGDNSEAAAGEAAAVAAMQRGLDFSAWLNHANSLFPGAGYSGSSPWEQPGQRGGVFYGLTPEVGAYLRDTNFGAVEATLANLTNYPYGNYLWYATRLGLQAEMQEASYHSPELGWSAFLAHAYVRRASQAQLRYWLDRPWGVGDLWHIQKLVATLEAPGERPPVSSYPYQIHLPLVRR